MCGTDHPVLTLLSKEFSAPINASCAPIREMFILMRINIPSDVTLKTQKNNGVQFNLVAQISFTDLIYTKNQIYACLFF